MPPKAAGTSNRGASTSASRNPKQQTLSFSNRTKPQAPAPGRMVKQKASADGDQGDEDAEEEEEPWTSVKSERALSRRCY